MRAIVEGLRSGAWVTRERARLVALAVLAAWLLAFAFLFATSNGLRDYRGRPLGTDFSDIYAAGTYVLEGKPTLPFDWRAQQRRERKIFGADTPFYGWHYPPFFLLIAAPLALIPYGLALAVWQGVSFALYLWAISAILSRASWPGLSRPSTSSQAGQKDVDTRHKAGHDGGSLGEHGSLPLLLVCAYPAVFINLGHGQNGFLTAALMGGALALLERRPLLAGVLFGLMAYKPQFGLAIPLVLIATGYWRAVATATATVLFLFGATIWAFGTEVWTAFVAATPFTRTVVLEQGGIGWYKIDSIFSWVRMWGGSIACAYTVQAIATLAIAALLVFVWRSRIDFPCKAAALAIAAVLATPYSLDYDLMLLAPAIAFMAMHGLGRGFVPYERSLLAALWLLPLVARSFADITSVPLAAPAMLMAFGFLLYRTAKVSHIGLRWPFVRRAVE